MSPTVYRKEGFGRDGTAASPSQISFDDRLALHLKFDKELMFSILPVLVVRREDGVLWVSSHFSDYILVCNY